MVRIHPFPPRHFYPRPLRRGRRSSTRRRPDQLEFLSTPSSQRATADNWRACILPIISIHALFAEGDKVSSKCCYYLKDFYPRPLRRGRQYVDIKPPPFCCISIHALFAEGDREPQQILPVKYRISIHALFAEGDPSKRSRKATHCYFYPRPLRRGRPGGEYLVYDGETVFLSTPSSQRATRQFESLIQELHISIHALFAEGDTTIPSSFVPQ